MVCFLAEMKLALFSSILCIILGLGIIIGGGVAYPYISSALDNLQTNVSGYLTKANNSLANAQGAINSTQVTLISLRSAANVSLAPLTRSGQLTGNIANNLSSISSTVTGVGQTLSNISVAGLSPFTSVGNTIASIGAPISSAADQLQSVSSSINSVEQQASDGTNRLNTITTQLGNINSSLADLRTSVVDAESNLPTYFNQIRLVAILALLGVAGLGVIFLLIGLSLFSLRRKTLENQSGLYRLYSKNPV